MSLLSDIKDMRTRADKKKEKKQNGSSDQSTDKVLKLSFRQITRHKNALVKMDVLSKLDPELRATYIPFLLPTIMKGTQIVEVRLTLAKYKITTTSGADYVIVKNIDASAFYNFTDCQALFDEYRVVRGELQYCAAYPNITNMCWGGAAVDYSISTAFGSFDAMKAHDTSEISCFNNFLAMDYGRPRIKWPLIFDPLPDQDWLPTTTNTQAFCYWKPFIIGTTIASTEATGELLGWMDFQFRGLAG